MDNRIGTRTQRPTLTISGNPVPAVILRRHGLDNEHYVVLDSFPSVDVEAEIAKLMKELPSKPTPAKAKKESEDGQSSESIRQDL